jgi:thiamine biosynthesis protein ThiI
VILKRFMLRAGERLARELEIEALITGDSVGQVSSQTLQNMAVISRATNHAVLRPLVGMNKEEIISIARQIGTYDRSAEVDEYCALVPKNPSTNASHSVVETEESRLDPSVLDRVFSTRIVHELRKIELEATAPSDLEIETIPDGTTVLDLRSRAAYEAWHYPNALHLEYLKALTAYPAFSRDQSYVLYCEVGFKSAYLAELMNKSGFRASHIMRGVRTLLKHAPEAGLLAP